MQIASFFYLSFFLSFFLFHLIFPFPPSFYCISVSFLTFMYSSAVMRLREAPFYPPQSSRVRRSTFKRMTAAGPSPIPYEYTSFFHSYIFSFITLISSFFSRLVLSIIIFSIVYSFPLAMKAFTLPLDLSRFIKRAIGRMSTAMKTSQ